MNDETMERLGEAVVAAVGRSMLTVASLSDAFGELTATRERLRSRLRAVWHSVMGPATIRRYLRRTGPHPFYRRRSRRMAGK